MPNLPHESCESCEQRKPQTPRTAGLTGSAQVLRTTMDGIAKPATKLGKTLLIKRPAVLAGLLSVVMTSLVGGVLTGCTVGPNFKAPHIAGPSTWAGVSKNGDVQRNIGTGDGSRDANGNAQPIHTDSTDSSDNTHAPAGNTAPVASQTYGGAIDTTWWRRFNDPELDALVERLAKQNLDVQAAAERVGQAMSQRQVVRSQGLPRLDGQASYQHQRVSKDGTSSLEEPSPGAPLEYNLYQDGLSASWELDLFGKVRRGVEAANANIASAEEARRGIALSVLSELARDYMQLRGAQQDEAIIRRNIALADKNIELVESQFTNGVATTLALSQARAQRETIASTLPASHTLESQLINAIGTLLAMPPRALSAELSAPASQPLLPPRVPVGLPGALAQRRPDIREAEAKLHEATAQTGVAVASFYPDVTLMGDFNLNGLVFANAFKLPDRAFGVGPSIDIPIFQGGRLKGMLHLRQAQQREAAINFHATVLRGWQEVDDAMTSYEQLQRARIDLQAADQQNHAALAAAQQRYSQGVVDFLNVTAAQQSVLQGERALVDNDTQVENGLVSLYVALGGGWEMSEGAEARPVDGGAHDSKLDVSANR